MLLPRYTFFIEDQDENKDHYAVDEFTKEKPFSCSCSRNAPFTNILDKKSPYINPTKANRSACQVFKYLSKRTNTTGTMCSILRFVSLVIGFGILTKISCRFGQCSADPLWSALQLPWGSNDKPPRYGFRSVQVSLVQSSSIEPNVFISDNCLKISGSILQD